VQLNDWEQLVAGVVITTAGWLLVTFLTRPTRQEKLVHFCKVARPGGPGWTKVLNRAEREGVDIRPLKDEAWRVPQGILCMVLGSVAIYSTLFATGYWIYGNTVLASVLTFTAALSAYLLKNAWQKLIMEQ